MRRQRKIKQRRRVVVSRWNGMKIWMRKFRVFFCFTLFHSSMILIVIPEKKNETRFYSMSSSDSSPDFLLKFSKLDVRVTCNVCSMMVMKLEVTSELINHRTVLSVSEMLLTTLQARRNRFFLLLLEFIHEMKGRKKSEFCILWERNKLVEMRELPEKVNGKFIDTWTEQKKKQRFQMRQNIIDKKKLSMRKPKTLIEIKRSNWYHFRHSSSLLRKSKQEKIEKMDATRRKMTQSRAHRNLWKNKFSKLR